MVNLINVWRLTNNIRQQIIIISNNIFILFSERERGGWKNVIYACLLYIVYSYIYIDSYNGIIPVELQLVETQSPRVAPQWHIYTSTLYTHYLHLIYDSIWRHNLSHSVYIMSYTCL